MKKITNDVQLAADIRSMQHSTNLHEHERMILERATAFIVAGVPNRVAFIQMEMKLRAARAMLDFASSLPVESIPREVEAYLRAMSELLTYGEDEPETPTVSF